MSIVYSSLNHVLRVPLAAEIHSRPFLGLDAPETISHLAIYGEEHNGQSACQTMTAHAVLANLCRHFGVAAPGADAKHFFHDFGRFRLKWECHTEFSTYTFAQRQDDGTARPSLGEAFERVPLTQIPQEWLLGLQGRIIVAAHVVVDRSATPVAEFSRSLHDLFEGNLLVGSEVLQGGEVWTDFLIQSDGFSRFIVRDVGLREQQAGRLVQRVLEIETYRIMALLGLPHAQQSIPALNGLEGELAMLTAEIVNTDGGTGARFVRDEPNPDQEQKLLGSITSLAAKLEKLSLNNSYRFSASQAYFQIVHARIEELREKRIEGFPTVGEFMDRRLTPALHTCAAVARRQEALARRVANTNDLLRTRVGIVQEQQNRQILQSMNTRAAQQLRLQQAVEGLSVVAISYYLVGLLSYAGKAAKAAGLPINADIMTGVLVPLAAAAVWLGLRRVHNHATKA